MGFYVVADEDTVAGFRHVGIPGSVVRSAHEAEKELQRLNREAGQDIIITTEQIANSVRETVNEIRFNERFPIIVEVPGPEGPSPESPSLLKMIREAVGIKF
jgi:vacuolar-type H+-ATPase subunit F/Vma7